MRVATSLCTTTMAMVLGLAGLLSGCAVTQKDCEQTDWEQLGRADGLNGRGTPSSKAADLLANCPAAHVTPDQAAYERGRRSGLTQWCSHDWGDFGAQEGQRGAPARDMYAASALCAQVGRSVDSVSYLSAHRQGTEQFCFGQDWSGHGYNAAAAGKPLDAGAVHAACRAQGVTGSQRMAYEEGAYRYCRTLDWFALGRRFAQGGKPADAQLASPPACLGLGVRPDAHAFHHGYETERAAIQARLQQQCAPRVLFEAGRTGRAYERGCEAVPGARQAYDSGRSHAQTQVEARGVEAELSSVNSGTQLRPGRPPRTLSPEEKNQELNRLHGRLRDLTQRMEELNRQYR